MEKDRIRKIAKLAQLDPPEEELEVLATDFNRILAFIETLQSVPSENVPPLSHVHDQENIFREDKAEKSFEKQQIFLNTDTEEDSFFTVPLVIDSTRGQGDE